MRSIVILATPLACAIAGCATPSAAQPLEAHEIGVVPRPPTVVGRDGGGSGLAFGRSVWAYGDTVLSSPDAQGLTWHNNSFSFTDDLSAADGPARFQEPVDAAGAPLPFLAATDDEAAFNDAHRGDPCAVAPCNARFAVWPGPPLFDASRGRAWIFYGLIYAEPGAFNFHSVGQSLASWSDLAALPERPMVATGSAHPTVLFGQGEPAFGSGAAVDGDSLYVLACDRNDVGSFPCKLGLAPLASPLDRSTWSYWNGSGFGGSLGDAQPVVDGAPSVSLFWSGYLAAWVALYSAPLSNDVVARTAPAPWGPWSTEATLFTADHKANDGGWTYDAACHVELSEQGGKVIYVSYSRPDGNGPFGAELALERVELK
jgi:hypothetical protein